MKRKNSFEIKYPLLAPYFTHPIVRENMTYNEGLERKYQHTFLLIKAFLEELNLCYDREEVSEIMQETFLKMTEEELICLIQSFLHSTLETKKNKAFIYYYRKTLLLGQEALDYIREKGIVIGRKYMEIPMMIVNESYLKCETGKEFYKGCPFKPLFMGCSLDQKKFFLPFVQNHELDLLFYVYDMIDESLNITELFIKRGITHVFINQEVYSVLRKNLFVLFILILLRQPTNELRNRVLYLIEEKRFSLIKSLMQKDTFEGIKELSFYELKTYPDEQLLVKLHDVQKNLKKTES